LLIALSIVFFINLKAHDAISQDITQYEKSHQQNIEIKNEKDISNEPPLRMRIYGFLLATILVSGFSIGLKASGRLIQNEKEKKELEKEKLNSELAFLKNQINPHFFFNTLNNIYSLIQINKENAQDAVLKLSKLMRYILYESEKGNTMLSSEIDFMHNYLDLMRLRITEKVDLQISFPENYPDCAIQPLLFVSFIENAFKHGVSNREHSFIHITLAIADNNLTFSCINSISSTVSANDSNSGIGLENVKKRLNLLYPNKHKINIFHSANSYNIELKITTS
jgi:two-component system, LytTR family, sensor kinase